jgi:ferredoxin-NADP reductase
MRQQPVKIKSISHINYNVLQIVTEKPEHFNFKPGQATEISINRNGWQAEKRPFTFTSLPESEFLEFTIKIYPIHKNVTDQMDELVVNDELILHEVFGTISYKGEGVFIAGGAGVTPFICILRSLQSKNKIGNNKLIVANNIKDEIILEEEFKEMLGDNVINILTHENINGYSHGLITEDFLREHITDTSRYVYLCGPPPMMDAVEKQLVNLNIDEKLIIKEAF